jgi:hypothetical protein
MKSSIATIWCCCNTPRRRYTRGLLHGSLCPKRGVSPADKGQETT